MPNLLTTATVMMCPHGGTVSSISANTRANAGGSAILRTSDTFTIAGCTFQISGAPHPCMQVQWMGAGRVNAAGGTALNQSFVGLCTAADQAPQGTVIISGNQATVSGQ